MAFKGVNKVCAQCIHDCKQFENVILVNCPKLKTVQTDTPKPYRREKSPTINEKGVKYGR